MHAPVVSSCAMRRLLGPAAAAIAWTAVLVQMAYSVRNGVAAGESVAHALVDYWSYFTVTTNTLVALVITVPALAPASAAGRWLARPQVSAMAAAAILVVGIAYHVLLSGQYDPTGVEYLTDLGLHYLVPPLFALHWLVAAPKAGLRMADLPGFAVYPILYLGWVLGRGAVVGEYPYFFVDAGTLGLLGATRNAMGILAFYYLVALVLLAVTAKHRQVEQSRHDRREAEAPRAR